MSFDRYAVEPELPDGAPVKSHLPGLPLGDPAAASFAWPLAVVRGAAVERNARLMGDFCAERGLVLAPHVKTTMSPELTGLQMKHGAWALTVATASQLRTVLPWGARRFLVANELVDPRAIRWLAGVLREDPGLEVLCYVDSPAGAELLAEHLADQRDRAGVLVEVGHAGGRAGVRDTEEAVRLGGRARTLGLRLAGVAGYEGSLVEDRSADSLRAVAGYAGHLVDVLRRLDASGLVSADEAVVSCGGSSYFDVVADAFADADLPGRPVRRVLRSGCYLLHDHGFYARTTPRPDLEGSVEVWSQVISHPEPDLVILDAGRRDMGFDLGLPVVLGEVRPGDAVPRPLPDWRVTDLNDQHAYVRLPVSRPAGSLVGTLLALGVSHPCTTLDKWRRLAVLDDEGSVTGYLSTHF
ncbi:alanine racemase [Streptomyces sp. NPDC055607]